MSVIRFTWDWLLWLTYIAMALSVLSSILVIIRWNIKLWQASVHGSRHKWYTPSAWASSLLYEVAKHAPSEIGMFIAGLYGAVEVFGLNRVIRTVAPHIKRAAVTWLRRKRVS